MRSCREHRQRRTTAPRCTQRPRRGNALALVIPIRNLSPLPLFCLAMRTTMEIDDHLLDAVRDLARLRRCSNGAVVSQLLRQALLGERVANAGAPMTSTAVVNRIRQQLHGL